ncbi:uncharacterized protein LOC106151198 [Lingula anatina]|uniref:Uncharacterized protein LOC106151198 n=1 Tax=Lingula anatina TaxID=7574 RepID=A0A1S3H1B6_LINAN|nr:uncharacterized protein LOC106151198 [Lingula anatina]XP_013379778.1 uncharacterized protein LOC106151198 [Lingula anatina]XP_013379786.1 uncharacterized protein LOC106151198 [Lingula anatina]XP_013379795.1 uncharacterized protein LOC106151198 [Lingula anatina]XP_013379803.1 uncharacterized protein LOC106151198 [Lingula anatina]XP_013379811.1 uncharacterized protein LOC106151198 [Lingula anatina]|eukprot:XP_013379768.1 uncharacterized protein LOC106151198 [Lingula anatina]
MGKWLPHIAHVKLVQKFVKHVPGKEPGNEEIQKRRSNYDVLPPCRCTLQPRVDALVNNMPANSHRRSLLLMLWCSNKPQESTCNALRVPPVKTAKSHVLQERNAQPEVPDTMDLEGEEFGVIREKYITSVTINPDEIEQIEKETRDEANSENWFSQRKGRITASNAGHIVRMKNDPPPLPDNLLRKMLQYDAPVSCPAMRHGIEHEEVANNCYRMLKEVTGSPVSVDKAGLVIHPHHHFLGASVDGMVTDNSFNPPQGVLEVKCPFSPQDQTLQGLVAARKDFCLVPGAEEVPCYAVHEDEAAMEISRKTCKLKLNEKHIYYCQVQMQLPTDSGAIL